MIALVLLVLAALAFLASAVNQTILGEGPGELIAWGLFFWAVAILLGNPIISARFNRE